MRTDVDPFAALIEDARQRLSREEGKDVSTRALGRRAGISSSTMAYLVGSTRSARVGRRGCGGCHDGSCLCEDNRRWLSRGRFVKPPVLPLSSLCRAGTFGCPLWLRRPSWAHTTGGAASSSPRPFRHYCPAANEQSRIIPS
jgi:hypothetical protein